jgi:hypothetical protein
MPFILPQAQRRHLFAISQMLNCEGIAFFIHPRIRGINSLHLQIHLSAHQFIRASASFNPQ